MGQISVYLNPVASRANYNFNIDKIKANFFSHELHLKVPKNLTEFKEMIQNDRDRNVECIFSIGGDGTINSIAKELIGSNTKLLVIPGGTANDFATELGTNMNLEALKDVFETKTTKRVDILKINDNNIMMTNGGVGIAADVAKGINKLRREHPSFKKVMKKLGKNVYLLFLIKEVILKSFKLYDLFIDSTDYPSLNKKIKSPLVLICNQKKLAGKFVTAPNTKNDDGKFNVTVFLHQNKLSFLKATTMFLLGKFPKNDPNILSFETDNLNLLSLTNEDLIFFGDGEILSTSKDINVSIEKKAIEVFTDIEDDVLCVKNELSIQ